MSKESLVVGVAGVFFGLLVGWIIGSQQGGGRPAAVPQQAPAPSAGGGQQQPLPLDETRASALKLAAQQNPSDAAPRVELGNMYFDAGRFPEAIDWYQQALKIAPKNINASTDLGIAFYYSNDPDRALAQFDKSLQIDASHAKTLLNIGIVRAFGKQDLKGAAEVWQKILVVAPSSEEARAARSEAAMIGERPIYAGGRWQRAHVFDRLKLPIGASLKGPAIVQQIDATTVIDAVDDWLTHSEFVSIARDAVRPPRRRRRR